MLHLCNDNLKKNVPTLFLQFMCVNCQKLVLKIKIVKISSNVWTAVQRILHSVGARQFYNGGEVELISCIEMR